VGAIGIVSGVTVVCPERERLAHEYRVAVDAFRESVYALKDLRGLEFDQAYKKTELRHAVLENARKALDHHRTEHRC
jgi:hypothetical protein